MITITENSKNKSNSKIGILDSGVGGLTVLNRLKVYHDQTQPLIDFYNNEGILKEVDGTIDVKDVFESITKILG